jgi:methionyl-tRNA formyltransferase
MGIEALMEAADLVAGGGVQATTQDESCASYEGWCREAEARINWHTHVDQTYNLIRGCDPAPGAWTLFNHKRLQLYDARKHSARTFSQVKGRIGAVTTIDERSLKVSAQGGQIEVFKLRYDGGKKLAAPQFCADAGLSVGTILG